MKDASSPLGYAIRYNDSAEVLKIVASFTREGDLKIDENIIIFDLVTYCTQIPGQLFDEMYNGAERQNALHVAVARNASCEILTCIIDMCATAGPRYAADTIHSSATRSK